MQVELQTVIGWLSTIIVSIGGAWVAMNARLYEVEARIRLLEAQIIRDNKRNDEMYLDMKKHIEESSKVTETLIRIEEALKRKVDKKFKE